MPDLANSCDVRLIAATGPGAPLLAQPSSVADSTSSCSRSIFRCCAFSRILPATKNNLRRILMRGAATAGFACRGSEGLDGQVLPVRLSTYPGTSSLFVLEDSVSTCFSMCITHGHGFEISKAEVDARVYLKKTLGAPLWLADIDSLSEGFHLMTNHVKAVQADFVLKQASMFSLLLKQASGFPGTFKFRQVRIRKLPCGPKHWGTSPRLRGVLKHIFA